MIIIMFIFKYWLDSAFETGSSKSPSYFHAFLRIAFLEDPINNYNVRVW